MVAVELDWASEQALDEWLDEQGFAGEVQLEVVQAHGPAGGWPVVRMSSSSALELWAALVVYTGGDEDLASELASGAS